MKRTYFHLFIIFVAGFILSACKSSQKTNLNLESDQLSNQQKLSSNLKPAEQMTASNSAMNEIKTLNDFENIEGNEVILHTTKGDITIGLYREETPLTTANFLTLVKDGFYDGIVFHRVIEDFMAQVGDPKTKDESQKSMWGTGGPGYKIEDEFNDSLTHDGPGVVSMANTGQPNTGGSQFFITHEATPWLDGKHAVFGRVTSGLDILMQIEVGDKINSVTIN